MPQLRKDPIVSRWVIIASERARRPGNFIDRSFDPIDELSNPCPLCQGQGEHIYVAHPSAGASVSTTTGDVTVVAVGADQSCQEIRRRAKGLYDVIDCLGAHEMVIETPAHVLNMADLDVSQIRLVFETYAVRMKELQRNRQFRYALAYKNYGWSARDNNIAHTHSHIVATPVRPSRVKEKLIGAKEYFDRNARCIYCDLLRQELDSHKRIVCETDHFVAVAPFAARFLFETWVLPKAHYCDYFEGVAGKEQDLAVMMKTLLKKLQEGLEDPAYNFVVHTAPFRRSSPVGEKWETIEDDYHWHIELMPRLTRAAGFEKGTGFYICSVPPEDMAQYLRGVKVRVQ